MLVALGAASATALLAPHLQEHHAHVPGDVARAVAADVQATALRTHPQILLVQPAVADLRTCASVSAQLSMMPRINLPRISTSMVVIMQQEHRRTALARDAADS